jgi:hypothetical protein
MLSAKFFSGISAVCYQYALYRCQYYSALFVNVYLHIFTVFISKLPILATMAIGAILPNPSTTGKNKEVDWRGNNGA